MTLPPTPPVVFARFAFVCRCRWRCGAAWCCPLTTGSQTIGHCETNRSLAVPIPASVVLHDRWMPKGAIRISDAMTHTEWTHTGAAATQRLRQCAQSALCRYRRVPPVPSAAPADKRPHAQATRAHPESRPYAWRSDGEHSPRRRITRRHCE